MAKEGRLISETLMYSVNKDTGGIVTHHLPYPRGSPLLENYVAKGFVFERTSLPIVKQAVVLIQEVEPTNGGLICSVCGFTAKSSYGLTVHQRRHKRNNASLRV